MKQVNLNLIIIIKGRDIIKKYLKNPIILEKFKLAMKKNKIHG